MTPVYKVPLLQFGLQAELQWPHTHTGEMCPEQIIALIGQISTGGYRDITS